MSDENVLAEAVGRLTEENRNLKKQLKDANEEVIRVKWHKVFLTPLYAIPILGVCLLVGYPLYKVITTARVVDYCYIEKSEAAWGGYNLKSHVEWGCDINNGTHQNIQDAVKAAELLHCPLNKESK